MPITFRATESRSPDRLVELPSDFSQCSLIQFARTDAFALALLVASAGYVLIEYLRRVGLRGTELACAQVETVRRRLFKIAAHVPVSVRRVVLRLSSSYPYQPLLRQLIARLVST